MSNANETVTIMVDRSDVPHWITDLRTAGLTAKIAENEVPVPGP